MKKILLILVFIFLISGCKEEETPPTDDNITITFKDEEEVVATRVIKKGEGITEEILVSPKEGHIFLGWNRTLDSFTQDTNVYAMWEKELYEVKFIIDKKVVQKEYVEYGTEAIAPSTDDIVGFTGWDKDFSNVKGNLEINAVIVLPKYTVKFYDLLGNYVTELEVEHGKSLTTPQVIMKIEVKEGYHIALDKSILKVTQDLEVNAIEVPNEKTIYSIKEYIIRDNEKILINTETYYGVTDSTVTYTPAEKKGFSAISESQDIVITGDGKAEIEVIYTVDEYNGKVTFIGHGGSYLGIMNTEEAFLNGILIKQYQALECDLKQTKDGVFVMCHDDTFAGYTLAATNYDVIKDVEYSQTRGNVKYTSKICTLARYLEICKKYNVDAVIELKYSQGINNNDTSRMTALMEEIKAAGMVDNVIFLGSQYKCLEWVRNNGYENIACQYLVNSCASDNTLNYCVEWKFDISFNISSSNPVEWVKKYQDAGVKVACYTFNQYTAASTLQDWVNRGVDYVTCDILSYFDVTVPEE